MSKKFSILSFFIIFSTLSWAMEPEKSLFPEASPYSPELCLAPDGDQLLQDLSDQIGFQFKNMDYLKLALTHAPLDIGHTHASRGYERLEFLGDAVLEHIMRDLLWQKFPHALKSLSKICKNLVSRKTLSQISKQLHLAHLSKRIGLAEFEPETLSEHTHGDLVESLIGAIYLDSGFNVAYQFVEKFWMTSDALPSVFQILSALVQQDSQQDDLGYTFKNPFMKDGFIPLNFKKNVTSCWEFLGMGVLKFTVCDMLYRRFPDLNEEHLTKKIGALTSKATIEEIVRIYSLEKYCDNNSLRTFIGHIYLDGGLLPAQDFILWHWTGGIVDLEVGQHFKKDKHSPQSLSLLTYLPSIRSWPSEKNSLEDLLKIVQEKPVYETEKRGEEHKPVFYTTVSSRCFPTVSACDPRKLESEKKAARAAFEALVIEALLSATNPEIDFEDRGETVDFFLKSVEAKLYDLGMNNFVYHSLACKNTSKGTVHRLEIQGNNITPRMAEGTSLELAKLRVSSLSIQDILTFEFQKIDLLISGENVDINESCLIFHKALYETKLKCLGYENFTYTAKAKAKSQGNILTYNISCDGLRTKGTGTGKTPFQAQLRSLVDLVDKGAFL
jgi:dsRNA-specific ribonuclease